MRVNPTIRFVSCLIAACLNSVALSAPASSAVAFNLPPEITKLRPSSLPGYALATAKCAICHSADYISYQPPAMTLTQWTAEIAKMQHAYGAPLDDNEVKVIGAYLAVAYGSAKASDEGVVASSGQRPTAQAASEHASRPTGIAPTQLLNQNNCFACHSVDKKIVGPAFKDVAARYRGNARAADKLAASIRNGSTGKWGGAAMPAFAGLSAQQIAELASFVLHQ